MSAFTLIASLLNNPRAGKNFVKPAGESGVLVTGASSGIGEACALYLDSMGFRVFAGIRKDLDGEALRRRASSNLLPVRLDVTHSESIFIAAEIISRKMGDAGLYGLVNNAGIVVAGPLEFLPLDKIREQFEVNVLGQVAVTQAMLPLIRKGRGRVVNMGSISGRIAVPFLGPYAASKHALEAVTDCLRVELRPWGIPVAVIEPGNVSTPVWAESIAAAQSTLEGLPDQGLALYGPALSALRRYASAAKGMQVDHVVRAVAHALMSKKPKSRYLVTWDTRLMLLLNIIPTFFRDWLISVPFSKGGHEK